MWKYVYSLLQRQKKASCQCPVYIFMEQTFFHVGPW